jgi:hypothetical protein
MGQIKTKSTNRKVAITIEPSRACSASISLGGIGAGIKGSKLIYIYSIHQQEGHLRKRKATGITNNFVIRRSYNLMNIQGDQA